MRSFATLATFARLAIRNVLRNRSRSALTMGAIFFGVAMTVVLAAFGNGLAALMVNDVVNGKAGAIQVHRQGYAADRENQPIGLDMPIGGEIEARMRAVPGVRAVAPRIVFSGMINNGSEATMFVGRGVDPVLEYQALPWAGRDVAGTAVRPGAPHAGVLGGDLARALGADGTGTVVLQATTQKGQQNALDLDLGGTIDNVTVFESKRFVVVPLAFAQDLLRMRGRATEYVVRIDDLDAVDAVAGRLRAALGPAYEIETWAELQPNLADIVLFQRVVVGIISIVFLVIVVFGVVNTMVMSVLERTREIGTMMAVGLRRARVGLLFLLEASILATGGAGLGGVIGRSVVLAMELAGGFAVPAPGMTRAVYHLIPIVPRGILPLAIAASIAGALAAALYPSWKAARMRPVEALRAV